jgi:hypothetical protein
MIGKAIQGEPRIGLALLEMAMRLDALCEQPANDDAPQPEDDAILRSYYGRRDRGGESDRE